MHVDGIKVKYIYSACVVISTPDIKVLCDPWFSEGVYDGSWFHFPEVKEPLDIIGSVDAIFISHIHPDHYDPVFLRKYFDLYGVKRLIIADQSPNYLKSKMLADGFKPEVLSVSLQINQTSIFLAPHKTGSLSDMDSALIMNYVDKNNLTHSVVNLNDIIADDEIIGQIKKLLNAECGILLLGYTGAGPYPQTYFDLDDSHILIAADKKKEEFFKRYTSTVEKFNPRVSIPFAGKYLLGGKLATLNNVRGVADPVEILKVDPSAVVLADQGGEIDTVSYHASEVRIDFYSKEDIAKKISNISSNKMSYERLFNQDEIYQLPLKRLILRANSVAQAKSEYALDYYFVIHMPEDEVAIININNKSKMPVKFQSSKEKFPEPRSEIFIDPRYLFGLMTNIYHWNNAEVGSQFQTRRTPNVLIREAQNFLNFFTV